MLLGAPEGGPSSWPVCPRKLAAAVHHTIESAVPTGATETLLTELEALKGGEGAPMPRCGAGFGHPIRVQVRSAAMTSRCRDTVNHRAPFNRRSTNTNGE